MENMKINMEEQDKQKINKKKIIFLFYLLLFLGWPNEIKGETKRAPIDL